MAEKFTTFPDIPINIELVTQEYYDYIRDNSQIYDVPGPITRKQLFDIYWTKEYSYTFSLRTEYGEGNKVGTKNSYTTVQRKGQTGAYVDSVTYQYGTWSFPFTFPWEEDREILGELNDSDPRKALIIYVTATCQVATGDNFLAKGLCTNPFHIKKEATQEEVRDSEPATEYEAYFGFGITTGFAALDKKRAPVGTPFGAFNIIEIDPETNEFKQTDKYYLSPLRINGYFAYQEGQEYDKSERIIRYFAPFSSYVKPPGLKPPFPNFKKIGNFKFHDFKPIEIWGDQSILRLERVPATGGNGEIIEGSYVYQRGDTGIQSMSVDFTVASSSKFNFEI